MPNELIIVQTPAVGENRPENRPVMRDDLIRTLNGRRLLSSMRVKAAQGLLERCGNIMMSAGAANRCLSSPESESV